MARFTSNTHELTTCVMVQDPATGLVVVQNRVQSWCGPSFPGGHLEEGELPYECAIREVREETGLTIDDLAACGVSFWLNDVTFDRYLVFCYRTQTFTGELIPTTEEGLNTWMSLDDLRAAPTQNGFLSYLPVFLGEAHEASGRWHDGTGGSAARMTYA